MDVEYYSQFQSIFEGHFNNNQYPENQLIETNVDLTNSSFDDFNVEQYNLPVEKSVENSYLPQFPLESQIEPESIPFVNNLVLPPGSLRPSQASTDVAPTQQRLFDEKGMLSAVISLPDAPIDRGIRVRSSATMNPYAMTPTGSYTLARDAWYNYGDSPFSPSSRAVGQLKSPVNSGASPVTGSDTATTGTGSGTLSQGNYDPEDELAYHLEERQKIPADVRIRQYFNLEPMAPLTLSSLSDPEPANLRPLVSLETLAGLAILGSPRKRLLQSEIVDAIKKRFLWYRQNGSGRTSWIGSIKHLLSLKSIFQQEERPSTEPGRGHYWVIDIDEAEIQPNKRERKRNRVSAKQLRLAAAAKASSKPQEEVSTGNNAEQATESIENDSTASQRDSGALDSESQDLASSTILPEYAEPSVQEVQYADSTQNQSYNPVSGPESLASSTRDSVPRSTYSSLSGALGQRSQHFFAGMRQAFQRKAKGKHKDNASVQSLPQDLSSSTRSMHSISSFFHRKKNTSSSSLAGALGNNSPYANPSAHGSNDSFAPSPPPSTAHSSVTSLVSIGGANPDSFSSGHDFYKQPNRVRASTGNMSLPRRSSYSSLEGALGFPSPARRAPSPSLRGSELAEANTAPARGRRLSLEPIVRPRATSQSAAEDPSLASASADPSTSSLSQQPNIRNGSDHSLVRVSSYSSLRGAVDIISRSPSNHRTSGRPSTPIPGIHVQRIRVAVPPRGLSVPLSNPKAGKTKPAKPKKKKLKKSARTDGPDSPVSQDAANPGPSS